MILQLGTPRALARLGVPGDLASLQARRLAERVDVVLRDAGETRERRLAELVEAARRLAWVHDESLHV